jgi:hypothetical protein
MSKRVVLMVWSIAASLAAGLMVPARAAGPVNAPQVPAKVLAGRLLAAQNKERLSLKIAPLTWSETLAAHAREWAKVLAARAVLEHSPSAARLGEGENLWSGTAGEYSIEEMIQSFLEERALFKRAIFPKVSSTGNWHDVGHYTQIIWQNTRQVGCAIESNAQDDYLVCRYAEPGNVVGEAVYLDPPPTTARMAKPLTLPRRASKKRRRGG